MRTLDLLIGTLLVFFVCPIVLAHFVARKKGLTSGVMWAAALSWFGVMVVRRANRPRYPQS